MIMHHYIYLGLHLSRFFLWCSLTGASAEERGSPVRPAKRIVEDSKITECVNLLVVGFQITQTVIIRYIPLL